jgi:hypothetical protein
MERARKPAWLCRALCGVGQPVFTGSVTHLLLFSPDLLYFSVFTISSLQDVLILINRGDNFVCNNRDMLKLFFDAILRTNVYFYFCPIK